MSDESLEAMFAAACLRAGADASFGSDLRAFLEASGVAGEDVETILAAPPRLALYRRLVRNNLTGVTQKMLKATRARLDADAPGAFDASFDAFLDDVGPRTHYLRDVPGEFLDWVEPRWRARTDLPEWAADLARCELVEFQIAAEIAPPNPGEAVDVAPDRALVFRGPLRVVRYAYAVHAIFAEEDARATPEARPTALLVYRDDDHAIERLELTPVQAAMMEHLLEGRTLGEAVRGAVTATGASQELADVARFLAELGERGVLLGGRAG